MRAFRVPLAVNMPGAGSRKIHMPPLIYACLAFGPGRNDGDMIVSSFRAMTAAGNGKLVLRGRMFVD